MIEIESWRKFLIAERQRMEDKHKRAKNGNTLQNANNIPDTDLMPTENEFKASVAALANNAEEHETACIRMMIVVYARKLRYEYLKEALRNCERENKFLVYTPVVTIRWAPTVDIENPELQMIPDRIEWFETSIRTYKGKRVTLKRRVKKVSGDQYHYGRSCFPLADSKDYSLIRLYESQFRKLRKMIAVVVEIKSKFKILNGCLK